MANAELIEMKAKKLQQLKDDVWTLEKQLRDDLIELDREAFGGLTWHEFMASIKEEIKVNDQITIKRESYRIDGTYQIDDNVKMTVNGNIYYGDNRFNGSLYYKESGRYSNDIPKKYQKQFDEIVSEMRKYQVERPSDRYSKVMGMSSF